MDSIGSVQPIGENHIRNLVTEEPRFSDEDFPVKTLDGLLNDWQTWFPRRDVLLSELEDEGQYLSFGSMVLMRDEANDVQEEFQLHDYLTAVQGDPDNATLPIGLPLLGKGHYTLKKNGVAYLGDEILNDGLDDDTRTWYEMEHEQLQDWEGAYDCAVAAIALGISPSDLPEELLKYECTIRDSGNVHIMTEASANLVAMPYTEKECGMSEECFIALENYFLALIDEEEEWWHTVVTHEGWRAEDEEALAIHLEYDSDDDMLDYTPAPIQITPQAFVAKLEAVDISTIPAEDMKCMHCWSNFDEIDDDIIELTTGNVQTDNSPVKLPCPHGHLIGKTCLMQIIDSGTRLCPQCRVDIVELVEGADEGDEMEYVMGFTTLE
ncbi:hypothetical protein E8E13_001758 [Curvularia kusanoi]|uniref:RING-type domain-containing protein n=1 Tax=Curvularia kusanoi TaxID=90978 RepID=A0A9P4WDK6_CURKU|nr:hypothetical protein E8E13_001758 [Curvularia kusanoi]